jgi:hypothetical protein
MGLLVTIYGQGILNLTLDKVKEVIKNNPLATKNEKGLMLKEWADFNNVILSVDDYIFVQS